MQLRKRTGAGRCSELLLLLLLLLGSLRAKCTGQGL